MFDDSSSGLDLMTALHCDTGEVSLSDNVAHTEVGSLNTVPQESTERIKALVQVISCDGADTAPVMSTVQSLGLGAEFLPTVSPETWFDQLARPNESEGRHPADLVVFVGLGERIISQRWIARADTAVPYSRIVAAMIDASIEHVAAAVNQGARGILTLPASAEWIAFQLREIVEAGTLGQRHRRANVIHRKKMATLTTAEVDVLDGMLEGLANKQLAHNLSIGLRTVELRRSKIMRKMDASSLAQLISFVCDARRAC